MVSGSLNSDLHYWAVDQQKPLRTFMGHTLWVRSLSTTLDGRIMLSGSQDKTARLWDIVRGSCLHIFLEHDYAVLAVCLSSDGRWAASAGGEVIRFWELDWDFQAQDAADWHDDAQPYLETFLALHTPYPREFSADQSLTEHEIRQFLTRSGEPQWTEEDFQRLLQQLQVVGYGWLRPSGVRSMLEEMAKQRG
jgi:WD40 repeat protein